MREEPTSAFFSCDTQDSAGSRDVTSRHPAPIAASPERSKKMYKLSSAVGLTNDQAFEIELYRAMSLAREVDALEERLVNRGLASFHVSGAGHEAVAAMAAHLRPSDWIHAHYRDKALMIARGMPLESFFDNLFCGAASASQGRQMSAHMSWRPGNVLSLCGPVGNNALQAVGVAAEIREREGRPIVLCCLGDGTTQQGEVMEAIAEAVRDHLPVLFLIENNSLAISTSTRGQTFFSLPDRDAQDFMGVRLQTVDGSDALACSRLFGEVVRRIRKVRGPAIVLMDVARIANHTHADDQTRYRSEADMAGLDARDPIARLRRVLRENDAQLESLDAKVEALVQAAAASAQARRADPAPALGAKRAIPPRTPRPSENGPREPLPMGAAITQVLRRHLRDDPRVTLFGQDIADPKGDVFGITRGLSTEFGARVANAPLSEATIVGKAVGRALAGGRPVAFLQFADFLPLAFNQIASELATIHWRTAGEWDCPVIVMAPAGGYRQGLGPFHAQSFEGLACHVPGLDVVYPSNAADAVDLLEAAFESGRPTLFFYPKALLHDAAVALPAKGPLPFSTLGTAALVRTGADITFVAYGNCVKLCGEAADWLKPLGIEADILDLRSLSPLDFDAVLNSARKTTRLVVVHEDVGTGGIGADLVARVAERSTGVRAARVVRDDTHVPCNFANQLAVLPSARGVIEAAARLLDLDVCWSNHEEGRPGSLLVRAAGSPSDETVTLIECHVAPGTRVREGDLLAVFETVKSAVEFESPADGVIEAVLTAVGSIVKVGEPFLSIATDRLVTGSAKGAETPVLSFRPRAVQRPLARAATVVGLVSVASKLGSRRIDNADLAALHPGRTAEAVDRLTGIATRWAVGPGETAVTLGADAARLALQRCALRASDITAVICATGTPGMATPSLASRIIHDLAGPRFACQAHDLSAACTGYLYALQAAYDLLQSDPSARVLVVTSEVLTPLVDEDDFETGMLFSDGATATIVAAIASGDETRPRITLSRPILAGEGELGTTLSVPVSRADGTISMRGAKVFAGAVRAMSDMLLRACAAEGCTIKDLDLVVPHQANRRILDAVVARLDLAPERLVANIRERGNTSSSSIPVCLADIWPKLQPGQSVGLTAFGGGFTYGAALLRVQGG